MTTKHNLLPSLSPSAETNGKSHETEKKLTKSPSQPTSSKSASKSYIIISNITLIVWAIFLAVIGTQAVSRKASTIILKIADSENLINSSRNSAAYKSKPCKNVTDELNKYIKNQYSETEQTLIPPIATAIEQMQIGVDWRNSSEINQVNGDRKAPSCDDYQVLFNAVAKELEAIAYFHSSISKDDIIPINNKILPLNFRSVENNRKKLAAFKKQDISLPMHVTLWVKNMQDNNELQYKFKGQEISDTGQPEICKNVTTELSKYIQNKYEGKDESLIPPIATVLDRLQISVNWRDSAKIDKETEGKNSLTCKDYYILFDVVNERLRAIANSYTSSYRDNITFNNNLIPGNFRIQGFIEKEIPLPLEAVLWVQRIANENQQFKEAISFLDLFVLLIILGGFGSWVYLVRLHINDLIPVKLHEYFYRPVLGMALAIGVFIINLSFHSLVSNSQIDKVRHETLIVLAFTAGLLSDKTYEFIEAVTGDHLKPKNKNENPPATK